MALCRIVLLILVTLVASRPSAKLLAQTGATQASASYLLIVETSHAMQPRAKAVYDSVKDVIDSNFKGRLHDGDKFGIWTFNDTLDTRYMAFASWSSETHLTSAMRAGRFAQAETYVNRPSFEKLGPELNRIVLQPGSVTVLLYTTGKNEIHGTTLDDQINATYKQWQDQQQQANMPLLTLLCAQDGKITHWSVTPAPWPFQLPALTPASQLAQAQSAALQIAESTTAKTPAPTSTSETPLEPSSEIKNTPPAKGQQPTTTTPTEPEVKLSAPPPQPLVASATETEPKNATPLAQASKSELKGNDTSTPPPAITQENPAPASVASAQKEAITPESPFFVYRRAPRKSVVDAATNNPVTAQPVPVTAQSVPIPAQPVPPAEPKSENASVPAAASTANTETPQPVRARVLDPVPTPETASITPPAAPAEKKSPIQSAVATPAKSLFSQNLIWFVCLAIIGIATAYCFMLWLRSYRRPAIPALTLHDIVERSTAPQMATPVRRANLSAEKALPPSLTPAAPDSTMVQE